MTAQLTTTPTLHFGNKQLPKTSPGAAEVTITVTDEDRSLSGDSEVNVSTKTPEVSASDVAKDIDSVLKSVEDVASVSGAPVPLTVSAKTEEETEEKSTFPDELENTATETESVETRETGGPGDDALTETETETDTLPITVHAVEDLYDLEEEEMNVKVKVKTSPAVKKEHEVKKEPLFRDTIISLGGE